MNGIRSDLGEVQLKLTARKGFHRSSFFLGGTVEGRVRFIADDLKLDQRHPARRFALGLARFAGTDRPGAPETEFDPVKLLIADKFAVLGLTEGGFETAYIGADDLVAGGEHERTVKIRFLARIFLIVYQADLIVLIRTSIDISGVDRDLFDRTGFTEVDDQTGGFSFHSDSAVTAELTDETVGDRHIIRSIDPGRLHDLRTREIQEIQDVTHGDVILHRRELIRIFRPGLRRHFDLRLNVRAEKCSRTKAHGQDKFFQHGSLQYIKNR